MSASSLASVMVPFAAATVGPAGRGDDLRAAGDTAGFADAFEAASTAVPLLPTASPRRAEVDVAVDLLAEPEPTDATSTEGLGLATVASALTPPAPPVSDVVPTPETPQPPTTPTPEAPAGRPQGSETAAPKASLVGPATSPLLPPVPRPGPDGGGDTEDPAPAAASAGEEFRGPSAPDARPSLPAGAALIAPPVTAALLAVVAPPRPPRGAAPVALRPSDAITGTGQADPVETTPEIPGPVPSGETPRTRDIVERSAAPAAAQQPAADRPLARPSAESSRTVEPPAPQATDRVATDPAAPLEPAALVLAAEADLEASPTGSDVRPVPETRASATATANLSTTSGASLETTAQIAAQIVRKLEGRSTRFEIALTPEDLGRVDISLDIDADGQLTARLAFDNPLAATELRGRVDDLRRQLQEAGFTVGQDALSFSERDPSAGQRGAFDRHPGQARAFGAASRLSDEADLATAAPRWISLTLTPDRVDMKV